MLKSGLFLFLFFPFFSKCQDSLLTYSRVLTFDSLGRDQIYDRALLWCSKSFVDSKNAIHVSERKGFIIGGKANIKSDYIFTKKNGKSEIGLYYRDFKFDWTIEIKESKLRFSLSNLFEYQEQGIYYNPLNTINPQEYLVSNSDAIPYDIMFVSTEKLIKCWKLSREGLVNKLDALMISLQNEINVKTDEW